MKTKIEEFRKRPFLIVLAIIVIGEILYLMHFNFVHIYQCTDQDSAKLMTHMVEMVKNKRILIPGWSYVSTCEIDTGMLLAIPFYIITKNVWVSFALSNCMYMPMLLCIVMWIFKNIKIKAEYALGTCAFVFMPYCIGMVDYLNMLFFKSSQYCIKILIPLLGIALLTYTKNNLFKIIMSIIWLFLVFVSGFSSGTLALATIIAPLVFVFIVNWLSLNNESKNLVINIFNAMILVLASVIGFIGIYIYNGYNNSDAKVCAALTYADEIPGKVHETIIFFFELINSLPPNWIGIIDLSDSSDLISGGGYVLRFVMILFIINCVNYYAVRFFKNYKYNDSEGVVLRASINYLTVIVLANVLIHFLVNYSAQRYYLVEFFPMLILAGIFFSNWIEKFGLLAKYTLSACVIAGICLVWYTSAKYCDYLLVENEHYDYCFSLSQFIEEYDVDNIITIDHSDTAEICRLILPNRKISNYSTESQNYAGMDWYKSVDDASYYGDSSLIVSFYDDLSQIFGQEVADKYDYVGTNSDYHIFVSYELGAPTTFIY